MVRRKLHDHAAAVFRFYKGTAEDLGGNPHMQNHDQKDDYNNNRHPCSEEHGGKHRDNRPRRTARNGPRKRDGKNLLSPVTDNTGTCGTAHRTAEADQKRHNGLTLQTELSHRVIKHVRNTGHNTDFLKHTEDKCDTEHETEHLHDKCDASDDHVTKNCRHNRRAADTYQPVAQRIRNHSNQHTDTHQRKGRNEGKKQSDDNCEDNNRLAPDMMGNQTVEFAEGGFLFLRLHGIGQQLINPRELSLAGQNHTLIFTCQSFFKCPYIISGKRSFNLRDNRGILFDSLRCKPGL